MLQGFYCGYPATNQIADAGISYHPALQTLPCILFVCVFLVFVFYLFRSVSFSFCLASWLMSVWFGMTTPVELTQQASTAGLKTLRNTKKGEGR